jgi:serine protease AprX
VSIAVLAALMGATTATGQSRPTADGRPVSVIVRASSIEAIERAVGSLGGRVRRELRIIHGFEATLPAARLPDLWHVPGVESVVPNQSIKLLGNVDGMDPNKFSGSWTKVAHNTHLIEMWQNAFTGAGVDVALIDSGVAPVAGITTQVINGPDLSFESQASNLADIDTFGHGTHMAGLIAGRDSSIPPTKEDENVDKAFVGAAPGARIVSLKVASSDGATDVSQVLAAIDWVVQHRNADGLNIRVLNLSFGTDSSQSYLVDPLAYAVEVAWLHGIVVVVSAGNGGLSSTQLTDPAFDPYVIAVGADDTKGSDDPKDDTTPSWQSRGDSSRHPDLVAPGKSIISLRDPSAFVDEQYPSARVGSQRFFKGSGSSQAAAIVSGAVATVLQQHPQLTPDQVKALLMNSADPLPKADPVAQGAGLIDMHRVRTANISTVLNASQGWPRSSGTGSLDLSRGSVAVQDDGVPLQGEQDIFGAAWDAASWAAASWNGRSWSGGSWNGRSWSGDSWSGSSWSGRTWSGQGWDGSSWSGRTWSDHTWSGRSWSSNGWTTGEWDGDGAPTALATGAWAATFWGV